VRYLKESKFGRGLVNKNGRSLDHLAERMHADGYLDSPDPHELLQKLTDEAAGSPVMSRFGDPSRMARDVGMPDKRITPGTSNPVPLDWKTLQDFRSSVGNEGFKARLAMNDRDAAALGEMKRAISGRVDEAAGQGLLKPGENFPADSYARWTEANAAHAARKGKYDNNPLGGMFRTGKDGEPVLQGEALEKGTSLGGSNTYQNAANALSLGVIDSPGLSLAAGRIPYVGRPALDFVRGKLGASKAERLAQLLAERDTAVNALTQLDRPALGGQRINGLAVPALRSAPRVGDPRTDRS
jgi:hypothetical protein